MKRLIFFTILLILLNFVFFSSIPVMDNEIHSSLLTSLWIENPEKSHITFHEFDNEHKEFWLGFKAKKNQSVNLIVGVPEIERLKDFKVKAVIMGPAIEEEFKWGYFSDKEDIMKEMKYNWGAMVVLPEGEKMEYTDPISDISSWVVLLHTFIAPADGDYFIMIIPDTELENGKIEIVFGEEFDFSVADILQMPYWRKFIDEFYEIDN